MPEERKIKREKETKNSRKIIQQNIIYSYWGKFLHVFSLITPGETKKKIEKNGILSCCVVVEHIPCLFWTASQSRASMAMRKKGRKFRCTDDVNNIDMQILWPFVVQYFFLSLPFHFRAIDKESKTTKIFTHNGVSTLLVVKDMKNVFLPSSFAHKFSHFTSLWSFVSHKFSN